MKRALTLLAFVVFLPACGFAQTVPGGEFEPRRLAGTMDFVQAVSVSAARNCFHRRVEVDESNHSIGVRNSNFWTGDTRILISLQEVGVELIEVNVVSEGTGFNQPMWNRSRKDLRLFLAALDDEFRNAVALRPRAGSSQPPEKNSGVMPR